MQHAMRRVVLATIAAMGVAAALAGSAAAWSPTQAATFTKPVVFSGGGAHVFGVGGPGQDGVTSDAVCTIDFWLGPPVQDPFTLQYAPLLDTHCDQNARVDASGIMQAGWGDATATLNAATPGRMYVYRLSLTDPTDLSNVTFGPGIFFVPPKAPGQAVSADLTGTYPGEIGYARDGQISAVDAAGRPVDLFWGGLLVGLSPVGADYPDLLTLAPQASATAPPGTAADGTFVSVSQLPDTGPVLPTPLGLSLSGVGPNDYVFYSIDGGASWLPADDLGTSGTPAFFSPAWYYRNVDFGNGETGRTLVGSNMIGLFGVFTPLATGPATNVLPPTIGGTPTDGQTLTATDGVWGGQPAIGYGYQWERCTPACTDVPGATASSFLLTPADVNATIRVKVTGTNALGSGTAESAGTTVVQALPPVNLTPPAISGSLAVGQTLNATHGTWSGSTPMTFLYQWEQCTSSSTCTDIPGASSPSYVLAAGDLGDTIRVRVTADNSALPGGQAVSVESAQTGTVAGAASPPANTGVPVVTGTLVDGGSVQTTDGTWSGGGTFAYAYQWQRCTAAGTGCVSIAGATASTYAETAADAGRTLRSQVTANNGSGSASAFSAVTGVVQALPPVNVVPPKVAGSPVVGRTLSVNRGTWTGSRLVFSYAWERCDAAGANCVPAGVGSTYAVVLSDEGSTFRVDVTATDVPLPGGGTLTVQSAPSAAVVVAPVNTALPSIDAPSLVALQPASADPGTWTGTPTIAFTYTWLRCDTSGASCVAVASGQNRAFTGADAGHTMRVRVQAANAGASATATSDATGVVQALPPANTTAPRIGGTALVGRTLGMSRGVWTGAPLAYSNQWERCDAGGGSCVAVPGQTGTTYALTDADVGFRIRVAVTADDSSLPGGASLTVESAPTAVVVVAPSDTALPTFTGSAVAGQTLVGDPGTWDGTGPLTYTYTWLRCDTAGANCVGASGGQSRTLTGADAGHTMRLRVRAANSGAAATADSAPSAVVQAVPPVNTVAPKVTGTAKVGRTLSLNRGTWTGTAPIAYSYQWQRCNGACADIGGATGTSYVLAAADQGFRVQVVVTADNGALVGGGAATATTPLTAVVVP